MALPTPWPLAPRPCMPQTPLVAWQSARIMPSRNSLPMSVPPPPPALPTGPNKFLSKHGKFCFPIVLSFFLFPFPLTDPLYAHRLTANYAPYPDGNVPRQGLYFSYRRVCDQYGIPHINTATLGKAIRLCFPTIKTRRLGVRGNSKYHCKCLIIFVQHWIGH